MTTKPKNMDDNHGDKRRDAHKRLDELLNEAEQKRTSCKILVSVEIESGLPKRVTDARYRR